MHTVNSHVLRLVTGGASVALMEHESAFWWVAVIPWLFLCILGIMATIPLFFFIGAGAGAAQADWMSDEFIIGLVFVLPTFLAVVIAEVSRRRAMRVANATSKASCAHTSDPSLQKSQDID